MRKFLLFFLCFMLSCACVFADDELSDDVEPIQDNNNNSTPVVVDITSLINNQKDTSDDTDSDPKDVYSLEPELVNMTTEIKRISPSDTSGFKAVMLTILGDYETTITDYEYRTGNNSYTSHSINIERDYTWLASACIFGLLLWCTFRSIGGICSRW